MNVAKVFQSAAGGPGMTLGQNVIPAANEGEIDNLH